MKKTILVCALLLSTLLAFGNEDLDLYAYLYDAAPTNTEQLAVLQNMAEAKVSGGGEFYARALNRLITGYGGIRTTTERSAASDQARLLAGFLGAEKYTAAANDLWRVYTVLPPTESLAKAEALMALGQIQAAPYFQQVRNVLKTLNTNGKPAQDSLGAERIAFGAIIALEKYKNTDAFEELYKASVGWYSDRITTQAAKSLSVVSDEIASYISGIIRNPSTGNSEKQLALQAVEKSKLAGNQKAPVAVTALTVGWTVSASDINQRGILASMRKDAIKMIGKYKTDDDQVYDQLKKSFNNGIDEYEKFDAVDTLTMLNTGKSVDLLAEFLSELNRKHTVDSKNADDEVMARRIIQSIGSTRANNPNALRALQTVTTLDWVPAVKTLAQNAITQIKGN